MCVVLVCARLVALRRLPGTVMRRRMDAEKLAALCDAAEAGDLTQVEALVAAGLDLEAGKKKKGKLHCTPLFLAASNGHMAVVQYLLVRGAKADAGSYFDVFPAKTPLHVAAQNGY